MENPEILRNHCAVMEAFIVTVSPWRRVHYSYRIEKNEPENKQEKDNEVNEVKSE